MWVAAAHAEPDNDSNNELPCTILRIPVLIVPFDNGNNPSTDNSIYTVNNPSTENSITHGNYPSADNPNNNTDEPMTHIPNN